jgi:hypothetical protein
MIPRDAKEKGKNKMYIESIEGTANKFETDYEYICLDFNKMSKAQNRWDKSVIKIIIKV